MRPQLTPKIRDEGLRGASKMMDDNLTAFGEIVEIVSPLLHHEGRQPIELTPTRTLRLSKDLPHDWNEQRYVLDFAA